MKSQPVAVQLRGRLGNHLFEFALVRAVVGSGTVLVDDLYRSAGPLAQTLVPGSFRIVDPVEAVALRQPPRPLPGRVRFARLLDRLSTPWARGWLEAREFHEAVEAEVDPRVFNITGPILFRGYFQNEDYFLHIADQIESSFRLPTREVAELIERQRPPSSKQSVAVVLRAGLDYEDLGWVQRFDWYRRSAERVSDLVGSPTFTVFSDIPLAAEAAAAALRDLGPATAMADLDAASQLHVIAAMDHAVIASSSFAWWGAWRGDHRCAFDPSRVVIAPELWIRPDLDRTPSRRWLREP